MNTVCLIAVKKKSLMSLILENLLSISGSQTASFESETSDLDELINKITDSRADVIVLEKSSPFAGDNAIARLLTLFAKMVVIIVSEDNNKFSVIRREERLLANSSDLVDFITSIQSAKLQSH